MKMAVVGCEASGKTVFMCALADYFGRDAANNPARLKLTPENAAANKFERLMFRQMRCQHQWPPATPPDRTVEIKWTLRQKGEPLASIDLLEFGGETFRAAFRGENVEQHEGSVAELLKYLGDTDFFVVLVSIKALLVDPSTATDDEFDRETEALWVTRGILEFIRKNRPNAGVVIGLTQADKYRNELGEAGGPKRFFAEHWPTVASALPDVEVVDVASVSKTDENGNPAEGYRTHGILPVMRIFAKHCFGSEDALENGTARMPTPVSETATIPPVPTASIPPCADPLAPKPESPSAAVPPPPNAAKSPSFGAIFLIVFILAVSGGVILSVVHKTTPTGSTIPAAPIRETKIVTVTNMIEKTIKVPVTNMVRKIIKVPVTNMVEKIVKVPVTNTIEKIVKTEVPITNTVEKVLKVQVTNTVEKVVKVQVTNTVEKVVKVPVTNTVEKVVTVPVTNTVEKIVKVEKVVTNVVEKIVEKPMASNLALTNIPTSATVLAPTNRPVLSEAELQKLVPPGYRIWTDYNGRKIIAKWTGVAVDESGITIVTRYNRRIDAVLWKFAPEDQDYIKAEIKSHTAKGEVMTDGVWVANPLLKKN